MYEVPATVAWLMRSPVRLTVVTLMPSWVHSIPRSLEPLTIIHCNRYLVAPSEAPQLATTAPSEFCDIWRPPGQFGVRSGVGDGVADGVGVMVGVRVMVGVAVGVPVGVGVGVLVGVGVGMVGVGVGMVGVGVGMVGVGVGVVGVGVGVGVRVPSGGNTSSAVQLSTAKPSSRCVATCASSQRAPRSV